MQRIGCSPIRFFTMLRALTNLPAKLASIIPRRKTITSIQSMFGGMVLTKFSDCHSYLEIGAKKVWASFKACDIVANVVVSTPISVTRRGSTTPIDLRVSMPDLHRLLTYPNENQTWGDLLYLTSNYLKWVGNAYWLKSEGTLNGDRPRELFSLNPCRTRVITSPNGELLGYRYWTNGRMEEFPREDVIHFKRPHPLNDYYGMGDLEAGESLIEDAANRIEYQRAFWRNGGAPSGVMTCEDAKMVFTDKEAFEKAQREWNAKYMGKVNAGKIAWLSGKWKYEKIGLTSVEMEDIERLKLSTNQIFILHGVPLSVAGIEKAANLATATIDRQTFREQTVWPVVKIIQDTAQTDLITGFGENLELKFNVSGLINVGQRVEEIAPAFDRGIITPNEFREYIGFPRKPENPLLDQHYINAGMTPIDMAGVANADQTDRQAQRAIDDFVRKNLLPAPKSETEPQQV